MSGEPLPRSFYARDAQTVAPDLLGYVLETRSRGRVTAGRIVEVEAYVGPHDPAAHGFGNRRTQRNDALFGPPGFFYVYFTYGMHWCANAVTRSDGFPSAVLIRALEPLDGLAAMRRRRGVQSDRLLCAGPARLCQALAITGTYNKEWLDGDRVRVTGPRVSPDEIVVGPRIGISKATDWPLRFGVSGSPFLSRAF